MIRKKISNRILLAVSLLSLMISGVYADKEKAVQFFKNNDIIEEIPVSEIDYLEVNDIVVPPASIEAALQDGKVVVKWSEVENAKYDIYRSVDNVNYSLISRNLTDNSYTDESPLSLSGYYKVKAIVNGHRSGFSKAVCAALADENKETGIYFGITGFNSELYDYPIHRLDDESYYGFTEFITGLGMKNGTLLYHSFEKGLDALQSTPLPADVSTVAIVTFTDGLDQGSMMMNKVFGSDQGYLEAMHNRIKSETVSGLPIEAFAVGLRGKDVANTSKFMNSLKMLSSEDANAKEVTDINEVASKFEDIAKMLSQKAYLQTVKVQIPGVANGTLIRFTFDNVSSATASKLYIEGKFNLKERSLEEVRYVGMTSEGGETIKGSADGIFVNFTFPDLRTEAEMDKDMIKEWIYISSNSLWQKNSEFEQEGNSQIEIKHTSAAVMLVFDCSSSLAGDFGKAKNNALWFISTLFKSYFGQEPAHSSVDSETFTVNGVSFYMVKVDGGTYQMGSNEGYSDERPVHSETIYDFRIGETEVTQGLWKAVMGSNPSSFTGDDNRPVECVSWNDCQTFIDKLNELTGQQFRLPTEAEWEYAARGGNQSKGYTYSGSDNINEVAWYDGNSGSKTHPVARKQPNGLGIYDMSGNVWEWTSDWYSENYSSSRNSSNRVYRGGSWNNTASNCRVAFRDGGTPDYRDNYLGLRLAL